MKRQAEVIATPLVVHEVVMSLMNTEGTCICGRIMRDIIDPKFILINASPSQAKMVIAAYCKECAVHINAALKRCRNVLQQSNVRVAPVDIINPWNSNR